MTEPVDHVPPPMSADALSALVQSAMEKINAALADADGNQDRSPYNLATQRGTVNHELVAAYGALERAFGTLASTDHKEVPWQR